MIKKLKMGLAVILTKVIDILDSVRNILIGDNKLYFLYQEYDSYRGNTYNVYFKEGYKRYQVEDYVVASKYFEGSYEFNPSRVLTQLPEDREYDNSFKSLADLEHYMNSRLICDTFETRLEDRE